MAYSSQRRIDYGPESQGSYIQYLVTIRINVTKRGYCGLGGKLGLASDAVRFRWELVQHQTKFSFSLQI